MAAPFINTLSVSAYTFLCVSPAPTSYSCVSFTNYTGQSTWGYTGVHNCTNYAAYRLAQNGASDPGNLGDAKDWHSNATNKGFTVNNTPTVGSIAQWYAYSGIALDKGHVAYVESVTSTYIDVTEDNYAGTTKRVRYTSGQSDWPDNFIHIKDAESQTPPSAPSFQSDGFSDVAILHKLSNDGFDAQVLYGSVGTPFQYNPTFAKTFSNTDGWDWNKVKTSSGDYNGDSFSDIAAATQRSDGGVDIHILWGGSGTPFTQTSTLARQLPASSGWDWTKIKLESGRFQADSYSDLAIVHERTDSGADVHVLYGSTGTPFQYSTTLARQLPGTSGWDWNKMKTSSGDYNNDNYTDIALAHQLSDDGADIHILWGGSGTPFQSNTYARNLPNSSGWAWSKMKLESGNFQSDNYSDLAILHERADLGFDTHVLYGSSGTPFQYSPTLAKIFYGTDGWRWNLIKTAKGDFNNDTHTDIAVIHRLSDGGADVHALWGGSGTPFTYPTTYVRNLPASANWSWDSMKVVGSN